MRTDDFIQPREWDVTALRDEIAEWRDNTVAIVQALQNGTACDSSANWWPHRHQMAAGLQRFVQLCDEELEGFGDWNERELSPDELHQLLGSEGNRLVAWVQRLIGSGV